MAIGTALVTELFGFSSGVYAYAKRRLIDYKLGVNLLMFSVPAAIVGSLNAERFSPEILKTVFGVGIVVIGWQLFDSYRREERAKLDKEIEDEGRQHHGSELVDASGRVFRYTVCNKAQGRFFAAMGGAFLGMISVGLAELQEYHLLVRCRIPSPVAVGTSIFVVVITVLIASSGHFYNFATSTDASTLNSVLNVVVFTIPGVIIGGQLGPLVQSRLNPDVIKVGLSILFVAVGIFMLVTTL